MSITKKRVSKYLTEWKEKGYPNDIPDEVPDQIMKYRLAPSYKAIALCLLKNDMYLTGLGFSTPKSKWYSVLKKIELEEREAKKNENK